MEWKRPSGASGYGVSERLLSARELAELLSFAVGHEWPELLSADESGLADSPSCVTAGAGDKDG